MKKMILSLFFIASLLGTSLSVSAQDTFVPVDGKQYTIKNVTHDMYLDAPSGQQAVLAERSEVSLSQRFTFELAPNQDKIPGAYRIKQVSSANYLRKSGNNSTQAYAYVTAVDGWTDNFAIVIEDSIVGETKAGYKLQSKIAYQNQNLGGTQRVEDNRYFCKDAANNNLRSIITGEGPDLWLIEEAVESVDLAVQAYQAAYDVAEAVKAALLVIEPDLENLKAVDAADYGKFAADKITILQGMGEDYSRDEFDNASPVVIDYIYELTFLLQSVAGLNHKFNIGGDAAINTGWYLVKEVSESRYLTYYEGFKFVEGSGDGYQLMYLNKTLNNNETRFAFFPYLELLNNRTTALKGSQNTFFNLCESGLINEEMSYTFKSGGTGNPTINLIKEDGTFTYANLNDARELKYRLILQPATDFVTPATTFKDGTYDLSFNGEYAADVEVRGDSVRIDEKSYAITRFGNSEPYTYAIGQNDDVTGYLTSHMMGAELKNGFIDAMPRPGFIFRSLTALNTVEIDDPVVSVHYYNLQGAKVNAPVERGVYIVKKTLKSQKQVVEKMVVFSGRIK